MYEHKPLYPDVDFGRIVIATQNQELSSLPSDEMMALFRKYGVLYFDGFRNDTEDFEKFAESFPFNDFLGHGTKSVRPWIKDKGKTTLAPKGTFRLYMHPELGYAPVVPDAVFFYCVEQSHTGGETLVCDGIQMYKQMPADIRNLLAEKKIRFKNTWNQTMWQGALRTDDANQAISNLKKLAHVGNISHKEDGSLHFDSVVSSVVKPFHSDEPAFNSSIIFSIQPDVPGLNFFRIEFEDGTPVPTDMLQTLDELSQKIAKPISWTPGNLAIIDNSRFLHGRNSFAGERTIQVKYGKLPTRNGHFDDMPRA